MTYGLRMRVNRTVMQSVLPLPLSTDDILTLVAIPGSCVLFAVGALLVEWLGLRLLRAQEKVGACGCRHAAVGARGPSQMYWVWPVQHAMSVVSVQQHRQVSDSAIVYSHFVGFACLGCVHVDINGRMQHGR